jgi:hypothetical protein
MEDEVKAAKLELFKFSWYMRGGLPIDLAYQLDFTDREIVGKVIEANLEIAKTTRLPFF